MMERLKAPVSVYSFYNHKRKSFVPQIILWEGKQFKATKLGYHHTFRTGKTLYHIFSVETENLFFRLSFNTDNLFWTVEEISDGEID